MLVVEDEKPLLKAIQAKMEQNGFDVVTARSVGQALNMLKDIEKIDVIWLDHYLLGAEDGLAFLAQVKNNEEWKKIPVYVVSNTATQDKIQSYMSLGVDKYYTKADYRLDEIIEDIKNNFEKEG